jgi:hypothetical protein
MSERQDTVLMRDLLREKGLCNESNVLMFQSETAEAHSLFHMKVMHNAHIPMRRQAVQ